MAIDPPQAKAFEPGPKVPPMTASQTLRISDQKSGGSGAYQRYPVEAPTRASGAGAARGAASARSQLRETRPSESANANNSESLRAKRMAVRRFSTFPPVPGSSACASTIRRAPEAHRRVYRRRIAPPRSIHNRGIILSRQCSQVFAQAGIVSFDGHDDGSRRQAIRIRGGQFRQPGRHISSPFALTAEREQRERQRGAGEEPEPKHALLAAFGLGSSARIWVSSSAWLWLS